MFEYLMEKLMNSVAKRDLGYEVYRKLELRRL